MKTGYHAVYAKDYFQGIADAKTHGFDFAQFELGVPEYYLDGFSSEKLKRIREYAEGNGVELTFHAPGDNVSLFADYPHVRKGNLEQFRRILEQANALNARHMTIHAGDTSAFKRSGGSGGDFLRAHGGYYEDVLYENLLEILSNAGDVLICLENYHFNEIILRAAQRLIDEGRGLWLTLDVAKPYDYEFYRRNRHVIREMHIHDRNEHGSHQTVGTGIIDFTRFMEFYSQDVYLNFEVRPVGEAAKSKLALEELWR
ncbi:MAG: sugar phosphate isomerase/epimerase [Oscillospiraceae bacterium]|nr:sugar phosphate isomerase/epimerase [Oscillospiraceae bacterium]